MKNDRVIKRMIRKVAADILKSDGMQSEKRFIHHGKISCYKHSLSVAFMSVKMARLLKLKVNFRSLIRGALLHDYFLYDWHKTDNGNGLHGFSHAGTALRNALRDFVLNDIERDIIVKHMFPLNISLPKYRESVIVMLADKICTLLEVLPGFFI